MSREKKKKLTIVGLTLWMFLTGVEYSVILPTGWFYLQTFSGVNFWYFGIVLSIFNLTCAIFSPLFGLILDKTLKMKLLTFVTTLFEIVGNIIYALRYSEYIPLLGRGICGVGCALLGPIYGELGRITTLEERTRVFAITQGARIFGIIIGPCFNLILGKINVQIGGFLIDYTNSPGFLMALLWSILAVVNLIIVFDLSLESGNGYTKVGDEDEEITKAKDIKEDTECNEVKGKDEAEGVHQKFQSSDCDHKPTLSEGLRNLFNSEILILIWIQFFTGFSIMCMDSFAPLFTKNILGWTVTYINIGYLVIGLVLLTTSILIGVLSKYMRNDLFLLGSHLLLLVGNGFILGLPFSDNVPTLTGLYLSFVFLLSILVPLNMICGRTLLSQATPDHVQGFVQGILVGCVSVAYILGPLFGTYMFDKLLVLGVVMNSLNVGTIILLLLIFKKLSSHNQ